MTTTPMTVENESATRDLDLTRYRTDQIAESISSVLAVGQSIRTVFKTTAITFAVIFVLNGIVFSLGNKAMIPWMILGLYSLAVALVVGMCIGLIRVTNQTMNQAHSLLGLLVETSRTVAADYYEVKQGEKTLPPAHAIVDRVYEDVFFPTIEKSIAKSLGIFGSPLLFAYQRSIGGIIRYVIRKLKARNLSPDEQNEITSQLGSAMKSTSDNIGRIEESLNSTMALLDQTGTNLKRTFLFPLRILFFLVVGVALIPIVVGWFLLN
ncbi:MAG: hypothetical protein FJ267_11345 [Planctomycetes bacterium]|nr:hypothetical protein [Planctomycetota bacterium]